jgi:uncharacterized protein YjbI with pentapeptide repeats
MMLFAWKAAVFPTWGGGLLCVATGVVVSHVMLPFSKFSWRSKALLSVAAAIIAAGLLLSFGPMRRPFDLFHANLSGQWLVGVDLRNANLRFANLGNAMLIFANLSNADLGSANLSNANLSNAKLRNADLSNADLSNADLSFVDLSNAGLGSANLSNADLFLANLSNAKLRYAKLRYADLSEAKNLTQTQLDEACGNANTKLLEGLTLKLCSPN